MQLKHLNILDTVRRVQGFLVRQAAALGVLVTAALSAQLDDAGTQLVTFYTKFTLPRISRSMGATALCSRQRRTRRRSRRQRSKAGCGIGLTAVGFGLGSGL